MLRFSSWLALLVIVLSTISYSQTQLDSADRQLGRDIIQQLDRKSVV